MEALLHERIEPRDRFVEDQQLGLVHEGLDLAELLPVPGRELSDRPLEVGREAVRQSVPDARVDAAPEPREMVEHRPPGQLRIQRQVAGEKADPAADLEALARGVESQKHGPSPTSA